MESLRRKILKEGRIINDEVIKVDSFLNHQLDPILMMELAKEFKKKFSNEKITKVVTIEASGIAIATMTGYILDVPAVYAKKKKPSTMDGKVLSRQVHSFTKNMIYDISIASEYIKESDNVLIVDDFLARGNAAAALADMIKEAGAKIAGIGIVIEKGFQDGSKLLREKGYRVESLAIIESMKNKKVVFAEG